MITFFKKIFSKINSKISYKKIPIIIISYNQLYYLKKQIDFLLKNGYKKIIILDNNSNYPPLLEYFKEIKKNVKIHRLDKNYGHLVFWENKKIFKKYSKGYFVVSDADIVPIEDCPDDFLLRFKELLDKYPNATKVGFSLNLETIPDANKNKNVILKWEKQFWKQRIEHDNCFIAELDTTFAIYRPRYKRKAEGFCNAIRTDYPLQAYHGGWYIDPVLGD